MNFIQELKELARRQSQWDDNQKMYAVALWVQDCIRNLERYPTRDNMIAVNNAWARANKLLNDAKGT